MPKEDKLEEIRDLINRLNPADRRNFVLIAKAKEKYGSEGTKSASAILRVWPNITEDEFWKKLEEEYNSPPDDDSPLPLIHRRTNPSDKNVT